MALRFYSLSSVESIMSQFQTQKQSLIVSLIDLKPQQLIVSQRYFISMNDNQDQIRSEDLSQSLTEEQEVVYSNIHSLLWISEPVKLKSNNFIKENKCNHIIDVNQNLEINQKFQSDGSKSTKNTLSIRYLYLPPLGEYLKRFLSKIKNMNNSSQSTKYPSSNQLENQLQDKLQARHKSMFVFARSISSSIVYEFGSKYIRFDHFQLNAKNQKSIEDIVNKLKQTNFQLDKNWIESFVQRITLKLGSISAQNETVNISQGYSKINSFVVIKNNSYSSQREYEVYRVKLSCSKQEKANTQLNHYNQVSMEIGSQRLMVVKSYQQKMQSQKQQSDPKQINELSLKLLNIQLAQVSLLTFSQSKAFENIKIVHAQEKKNFSKQKYVKVLNFQYLYSILVNKMKRGIFKGFLNQIQKNDQIELNYQNLSQIFLYYLFSVNALKTIRQLKLQEVTLQILNNQQSLLNETTKPQKDQHNQISIMLPEEKLASSIIVQKVNTQNTSFIKFKEDLKNLWERIFMLDQVQACLNQQFSQKTSQSSQNSNLTTFDQLRIIQELIVKSSSLISSTLRQQNENSIIDLLEKYQQKNNFNAKKANAQLIVLQAINVKLQLYKQKNILKLMENEVKLKNHESQINYQEVSQFLEQKLKQHRILLYEQLPLLFSYPLQIQDLNKIIKIRQQKISELQFKVASLQKEIFERQIKKNIQQQKIQKYQQDQIFYHKILQELNAKEEKLMFQIQDKKKTLIELQCTRIKNMHLNQTIEQQKITQARLLQEKNHFLEAISHLSKENIYYINYSEELKSTVSQLQLKISKFQTIDLDLSQRISENQVLKEQLQNIRKWKQDIEAEHDRLIDKQIAKFNHILEMNFDKYKQLKLKNEQLSDQIKQLNQKNISSKNDNLMFETQLKYIKERYFNFSHLEMQIPLKLPNQPYLSRLYEQNKG